MGNAGSTVLTGGHWVRKSNGIRVWVPDPTPIRPTKKQRPDQRTRNCLGCDAKIRPARAICRTCYHTLNRLPPITTPGRPVCDCGCLLAHENEDCPACLVAAMTEGRVA